MAQSNTLADLRQRFYDRFDEGQSLYIAAQEANRLINEGGRHLHNRIVTASEDYIWSVYPIQVNLNQQDYALPTDFFKDLKVFGVYTQPSGSLSVPYYWPLKKIMKNEYRGGPASVFRYPFDTPFGYMIMGQTLRVTPLPNVVINFSLEMWYAPHYSELVNDSDVMAVSVVPGWDEFVVNYAVISAKIKEESAVADLQARNDRVLQMIDEELVNRDLGMPQRVTDILESGANYWGGGFGFGYGGMF